MIDEFELFDEPNIVFGAEQRASDPHDGLALFGALEKSTTSTDSMPHHAVIGTNFGIKLWRQWSESLNNPSSCVDISRHRPWPPYPGFDVAFGSRWPSPVKTFELRWDELDKASRKINRNERAYSVANQYLDKFDAMKKLDADPALVVCVVPDFVYQNCRPKSYVKDTSDSAKDPILQKIGKQRAKTGQMSFLENKDFVGEAIDTWEQYGFSTDFRRQLKGRVMRYGMPIQLVKESTLAVSEQVARGEKGTNPLSDRLWNLGTALYYKCGRKPWKLDGVRDGVCYIGISYKRAESTGKTACCAAQMFLDSGDGIVFLGDFGPWYSEDDKEFHLTKQAAEKLLRGTLETYAEQDGAEIREVFLHAKSGINDEEFEGFQNAVSGDCKVIGVRVKQDRRGPRLYRDGRRPVMRGMFWKRTPRYGFLYTNGFKPRIGTYDGFEVPVPLEISIQQGDADISTVAKDILGLTKLNYNACVLGEGMPITVKFSGAIGEILLANPSLPRSEYRHNFKFYI